MICVIEIVKSFGRDSHQNVGIPGNFIEASNRDVVPTIIPLDRFARFNIIRKGAWMGWVHLLCEVCQFRKRTEFVSTEGIIVRAYTHLAELRYANESDRLALVAGIDDRHATSISKGTLL